MLTVRIEPSHRSKVEQHAIEAVRNAVASQSALPMIPAAHRAVHPCCCIMCRVTFWDSRNWANVCSDPECVKAARYVDDE